MTVGFVVGKFYPPHRGHKHLIDEARRESVIDFSVHATLTQNVMGEAPAAIPALQQQPAFEGLSVLTGMVES